jgi:hypothetical protein
MNQVPITILLLIMTGLSFGSCADTSNWTEFDWKLASMGISPEEYANSFKKEKLSKNYIENVLYVGMPEEIFLQKFKMPNAQDSDQPYVVRQEDHTYTILIFPRLGDEKAKITFHGGRLAKYELRSWKDNPFGYVDRTYLLVGLPKEVVTKTKPE